MKTKLILILLITALLVGCNQEAMEKDDEILDIWCYLKPVEAYFSVEHAVNTIKEYAENQNIKVNVTMIKSDEMSIDDYIMKRNIALAEGNVDIIIDNPKNLFSIRDKCGDYKKLNAYDDILDNFRNGFCIPVGVRNFATLIDGKTFIYYGEEIKPIMKFEEYLELKQNIKAKGARFVLNKLEMADIIDYYVNKYDGLKYDEEGRAEIDKTAVKSIVVEACEDLKNNYDFSADKVENAEAITRDMNTPYTIYGGGNAELSYGNIDLIRTVRQVIEDSRDVINDTIFLISSYTYSETSLFISNKAEQSAYDMASVLFSDEYMMGICDRTASSPTTDTLQIRDYLEVDDDWRFIGDVHMTNDYENALAINLYDQCHDMIRNLNYDDVLISAGTNMAYEKFLTDTVIKIMNGNKSMSQIDDLIADFEINLDIR